jgi:hypothetical protein
MELRTIQRGDIRSGTYSNEHLVEEQSEDSEVEHL